MTTGMTTDPLQPADLESLTIRELVAELTRIEDRLNSARAATSYHAGAEVARLENRMRTISAHLRRRRASGSDADARPMPEADEADRIEQSLPVVGDPDEEYPHQQEVEPDM